MSTIHRVRVIMQAVMMLPALALLVVEGGPQTKDFDEPAAW